MNATRARIELPAAWAFSTELAVRITDVNYGGHAGHVALMGLLHEARMQWLKSAGFESELLAPPIGLILVDLQARFKREARYGDVLTVRLAPQGGERGFSLVYQAAMPDGAEVLRARTEFVFFDYAAHRMTRAPSEMRSALGLS